MVDSVYTIWKTCPSREHSSSAATCRGDEAGSSWAAFLGTWLLRCPTSTRTEGPLPPTAPPGEQPMSGRLPGPQGPRCVSCQPSCIRPPGPPTPPNALPRSGPRLGNSAPSMAHSFRPSVKAGSYLGSSAPGYAAGTRGARRGGPGAQRAPQQCPARRWAEPRRGTDLREPEVGVPAPVLHRNRTKKLLEAGNP